MIFFCIYRNEEVGLRLEVIYPSPVILSPVPVIVENAGAKNADIKNDIGAPD